MTFCLVHIYLSLNSNTHTNSLSIDSLLPIYNTHSITQNTKHKHKHKSIMSPNTNTNTRWCPTPEQLMILEELYWRGLKTPNATQIQRITGHLSMYGKIQGKNVFYWFQNHKARDRQKLRKKLAKQLHHHHLLHASAQTHFTYFPHQQYFPLNFLHAQQHEDTTNAAPEMGPGVMSWRAADLLIPAASYNGHGPFLHEYAMATDAGPASSCVTGNSTSSKPIQTLELFPLRSTKEEDDV